MYYLFKYIITRLTIAVLGALLIYFFYPIITGHQNLTNLGSVFLITTFCSFFIHLIYLAIFKWLLRNKKVLLIIKSLVCFAVIPVCFVAIGLFTYGVDYKGLLLSAVAIGLPNASLPYLEKKIG